MKMIRFNPGYNNVITNSYLAGMLKSLITVGNSKAVILPAELIKKFKLEKVLIEEVENGILIRPVEAGPTSFQKKLDLLKKNKSAIYNQMEAQAKHPDTIRYYSDPENNLSNLETDIID